MALQAGYSTLKDGPACRGGAVGAAVTPLLSSGRRDAGIDGGNVDASNNFSNQLPDGGRLVPNNQEKIVLVDESDWDAIKHLTWTVINQSRCASVVSMKTIAPYKQIMLHLSRVIMQPTEGMLVDHINGNRLDNRRCNLRICTPQENAMNRRKASGKASIYRGVSRMPACAKSKKLWRAIIYLPNYGKQKWLGYYATEQEAALAYDNAARELHGEFACLNFPNSGEQHALRHLSNEVTYD